MTGVCDKCGEPFDWMPTVHLRIETLGRRVKVGSFHQACVPRNVGAWHERKKRQRRERAKP